MDIQVLLARFYLTLANETSDTLRAVYEHVGSEQLGDVQIRLFGEEKTVEPNGAALDSIDYVWTGLNECAWSVLTSERYEITVHVYNMSGDHLATHRVLPWDTTQGNEVGALCSSCLDTYSDTLLVP